MPAYRAGGGGTLPTTGAPGAAKTPTTDAICATSGGVDELDENTTREHCADEAGLESETNRYHFVSHLPDLDLPRQMGCQVPDPGEFLAGPKGLRRQLSDSYSAQIGVCRCSSTR